MNFVTRRCLTGAGSVIALMLAAMQAVAQEPAELARCSAIEDAEKRLACYDAASGKIEPAQESQAVAPGKDVAPQQDVETLTDDVGREQLDRGEQQEERTMVRGTVTNCKRDASGRYYFYFDNGQVWKQKDSDRLPFRNCSFDVKIERDFFGYRMRVEGRGKDIRISRVR